MNRTNLAVASIATVLALTLAALAVGSRLPAHLLLPTHWGLGGQPDRFADKWLALFLPVAMAGGVSFLLGFLPALEPRLANLERSAGLYHWTWAALLLVSAVIELIVISVALRWGFDVDQIIIGAIGLTLILVGNQLGKSRSMYLVGIRTPWTLASEDVWIKTHRLGGKLMVGGGLLMILAALVPIPSGLLSGIFGATLALIVGAPAIYSYLLWRHEQAQSSE
jgi:uncharacterized membrane protein